MIDLDATGFIIAILLLAIFHAFGEVMYKNGFMLFIKRKRSEKGNFNYFYPLIIPILVILFSIAISLGIKVIYGIILGSNELSITAGLFLGSISIFSVIFGKFFFQEQLLRSQVFGILLIALGIILLV